MKLGLPMQNWKISLYSNYIIRRQEKDQQFIQSSNRPTHTKLPIIPTKAINLNAQCPVPITIECIQYKFQIHSILHEHKSLAKPLCHFIVGVVHGVNTSCIVCHKIYFNRIWSAFGLCVDLQRRHRASYAIQSRLSI